MSGGGGSDAGGEPDVRTELIEIVLASLKELAAAGRAEAACRLAGRACAALRQRDQTGWGRFNALLHRLSRQVAPVD